MANAKIIAQKEEAVKELAEKIKSAKVVVLTDYRGITVEDVTKLRADLRATNSEYIVIKNNITRRALKEAGVEGIEESVLEGPTALIIGNEDYLPTLKALYAYVKGHDFYKIKYKITAKGVYDDEEQNNLCNFMRNYAYDDIRKPFGFCGRDKGRRYRLCYIRRHCTGYPKPHLFGWYR